MIADKVLKLLKGHVGNCVVGELPSSPNNVVAIIEYDSDYNITYFGKDVSNTQYPIVKVVCRNDSYPTGSKYIETAYTLLNKYTDNISLNLVAVGSPIYLGKGEAELHEFQVTFKSIKI